MSDLSNSPKPRLLLLENHCRREVFNVHYLAEYNIQRKVREIQALSLPLARLYSGPLRCDLIACKNEEIRRFWRLVKAKVRELHLAYISQKQELQALASAEEGPVQTLTSPLFQSYQPVLFHQSLLGTTDPDVSFLPFHLKATESLPVRELLTRMREVYGLTEEIQRLKAAAKGLLASNEPTTDETAVLENYHRLSALPVPEVPVLVVKWNICVQASEVLAALLFRVKALLHQVVVSRPRGENSPQPELPFQEELEAYAETCFLNATKFKENNHKQESGFWLSLVRKMHQALGRESHAAATYYNEALASAGKYAEALAGFKSGLRYLNAEDMDDGSRAVVMKLIADTQYNLHYPEKKVKWLQRLLDLGLDRNSEAVDLYDIRITMSYELTHQYRFEESEAVLLGVKADYPRVGTRICNAFGFLYLVWDQFSKSEEWLQRGIALSPRDQNNLHLNLSNLHLKLGRLQSAKHLIVAYLRTTALNVHDKAYALASLARLCLEREKFNKAGQLLARAAILDEKWASDTYQQGRRLLFAGMLSLEIGRFEQAEAELTLSLGNYSLLKIVESPIVASSRLAEAYLLQGKVQEAEACLASNGEVLERAKHRTAAACLFEMQGRVCLAKQELVQARDWLDKALAIQEPLLPGTKAIARTYSALGCLELAAGRHPEAYERFTQAVQIQGIAVAAAEAYSGLAELYVRVEDWQSAQACLHAVLPLFHSLPAHPMACKLQLQLQALPANPPT